jgi:ABC-type Fe3+/spermidine/putrescine transport system ATPase subunit
VGAHPALHCIALDVGYGDGRVLREIDLTVGSDEIVALLGASGSGKSTLLHAVAGLLRPSAGEIWLAGRRIATARWSTPPERRAIGLVFQNFALWPHLTVLDTVAYPQRRAGRTLSEARANAFDLLKRLGIADVSSRRPAELSGGQQQRVGLARALAREARLFLLDEPTAHLDTHLRHAFQESVLDRRADTGASVVYATHDPAEALAVADQVALVVDGRIIQTGSPETVYAEPVSRAAAVLTGPCSVLEARIDALERGRVALDFGDGTMIVPGGGPRSAAARPSRVLLRPDWVYLGGPFRATIGGVAFHGPHTDYRLDTVGGGLTVRLIGPPQYAVGAGVTWGIEWAWAVAGEQSVSRPR